MGNLRPVGLLLFFALAWSAPLGAQVSGSQPNVTVNATIEPNSVINDQPVRVLVELKSAPAGSGFVVKAIAPEGFQVQPSQQAIPPSQSQLATSEFSLQSVGNDLPVGQSRSLVVQAFTADGKTEVAETRVSLSYISRIPVYVYLLLGGAGILIGYFLRLLIKVLQTVPAPAPAPIAPGAQAPGRITAFVQKHYYLVDCGVTLVIGILSMILLLKDNHVPDSGLYWYSALGAGVALGLLTNSELVSKLGR